MVKSGTTAEDDDKDVLWEAAPHTLAKHQVYRHYLSKWMPIIEAP
jgi:hypothetical protein